MQGKPAQNVEVQEISDRIRVALPTAMTGFSRQNAVVHAQESIIHQSEAGDRGRNSSIEMMR